MEKAKEELANSAQAETAWENLVQRAFQLEGRIYEGKTLHGIPDFKPLHERCVPIISVLNLKGGVGKTTITAYLGSALAAKGYRVLLVDLDLQGSLSSLFIDNTILKEMSDSRFLLQHLLSAIANQQTFQTHEFCHKSHLDNLSVLPSTDKMGYAELTLTMQWLLRTGTAKDNRFLLRKILHQRKVTNEFDIILLDCPPILNMCCINALAASDYLLIPVLPSEKAAERVPILLNNLQSLRPTINPDLHVLGAVLNRAWGGQLSGNVRHIWDNMKANSMVVLKEPLHAFETIIPQTTEVRDNEDQFSPPEPGSDLHMAFSRLVAELTKRIPHECLRIASPVS